MSETIQQDSVDARSGASDRPESIREGSEAVALRIGYGEVRLAQAAASALDVGCLVELNCAAEDRIALCADEQTLARGDAVSMDGKLAIRIVETVAGGIQASSAGPPG